MTDTSTWGKGLSLLFSLEIRKQALLLRIRQAWNKEPITIIRVWKKHYETCERKVSRRAHTHTQKTKTKTKQPSQGCWWILDPCHDTVRKVVWFSEQC